MGYRFPLAQVLRVRELAADREEQTLTRILGEQARLRQQIAAADAEIAHGIAAREQSLSGTMRASHLLSAYSCVEQLRGIRTQLEEQLQQLEQARLDQARACERAYQSREVLASLRGARQEAWQNGRDRAEQKQADDATLRRFLR